ncbi:MAG TPA: 3'-5' exonuclease [Bacteroidales bacterium]|jgi:inhibitor of KinA sporulation pathway (predicted exonuclease)|nr:3'-5' exonuclease [Bacteroidales bacterium]
MIYIIMDLELTCWKDNKDFKLQEIIEIGAVKLNSGFEKIDEFDVFIRPIENPLLSEFCHDLTHITQKDVDGASTFNNVLPEFIEWIGAEAYVLITWGNFDLTHMQVDCKRHKIKFPKHLSRNPVNLKQHFADFRHIRPCGMDQALQMLNIPLTGKHHRGIDDARNISKIAKRIL